MLDVEEVVRIKAVVGWVRRLRSRIRLTGPSSILLNPNLSQAGREKIEKNREARSNWRNTVMLQSTHRYRHASHALLVACAFLLIIVKPTFAADSNAGTSSTLGIAERELALKKQEFDLKLKEFALKEKESQAKKQEVASLQRIEQLKTYVSAGSLIVAAIALAIPVWIAAINIRAQRKISDEQAKLTFQMKVADLALLNAENATQAKEKARALASLFGRSPLLPEDFAERFEPKNFKIDFGHSIKTRQKMLELLAQYPGQREQILKDWYVLFQWDSWWVEPLLSLNDEREKQKLNEMRARLIENERQVNEKNAGRKADNTGVNMSGRT